MECQSSTTAGSIGAERITCGGIPLEGRRGQIWQWTTRSAAARLLTAWCRHARVCGSCVLLIMVNTLNWYRTGMLNWYRDLNSSGPMEGIHDKIAAIQRRALGCPDKVYLSGRLGFPHLARILANC